MLTVRSSPTEAFVFIYRVRPRAPAPDQGRFCTVLSLATRMDDAEKIAINCVHQHGFHILRTDTAARLERDQLARYPENTDDVAELQRYGTVFHLG